MRLILAISLLLLALPLRAQEAPGEDVPGMRTKRDSSVKEPVKPEVEPQHEPSNGKDLSVEEKERLQKLFKGKITGEDEKPEAAPAPAASAHAAPAITPLPGIYMNTAHLLKFSILNKQTTRLYPKEVTVGDSVNYGSLNIKLVECWRSSPDSKPDSAALLQITETGTDGEKRPIFLGWLFAASPSLNALTHPIYDITIKECK